MLILLTFRFIAVGQGSGGRAPFQGSGKPGRDHEDSESDIDPEELKRARELIKRARAKDKARKAASPSRAEMAILRRQKGDLRFTPCLPCLRGAERHSRGHCHDTRLPGALKCYECTLNNHQCEEVPEWLALAARSLLRELNRPVQNVVSTFLLLILLLAVLTGLKPQIRRMRATVKGLRDLHGLPDDHTLLGGDVGSPEPRSAPASDSSSPLSSPPPSESSPAPETPTPGPSARTKLPERRSERRK